MEEYDWERFDDGEIIRLLVIAGACESKAIEMVEKRDRPQVKVAITEWLRPNG